MALTQSAVDAFVNTFASLGLGTLGQQIADLVKDPNLTDADLSTRIYELPAYKQMFPGMDTLRKQGNVMTEGQYLQQETAYKQVLKNNNLPVGFYDSKQDFADWMASGVSPQEVQQRVTQANQFIQSSDPNMLRAAGDYYGLDSSHLMAYILDPDRGQPLIDRQVQAMQTGAVASDYGFNLNRDQAMGLVTDPAAGDITRSTTSLANAFAQAQQIATQDQRLSNIDQTGYDPQSAIDEVLRNSYTQQRATQARAQREVARFNGSSGGGDMFATARTGI